jgi:hypothetical protein
VKTHTAVWGPGPRAQRLYLIGGNSPFSPNPELAGESKQSFS